MKNDDNKTDWTFVLVSLIICTTLLLSGAKCSYRATPDKAPISVDANAR